ncbi:hemerythrin HHE cation binding domain-containing protein [Purpureocillium lavendulum]|uniref:Hemerythrin HHE cation binding domain-containing protein n=1 Tax=Purpureocillium lavendulum TaxID=1247861 RepID=A0AB34FYJ1_9HYPO|nr:hemerythrin HHE cation binding domain-containing protein [Purpureocillium lavendulum]
MAAGDEATTLSGVRVPFALITPSVPGDKIDDRAKGAKLMAAEMCIVHNCLIRGINAIYVQCVNVATKGTDQDKIDFVGFARAWGTMIEEHHSIEETDVFPEINDLAGVPGLMDANVEEHAVFHDGLALFIAYLDKVKAGEEALDGGKLQGIINDFMPVLRDHLEHEITTLVELEKYSDKCDWSAWFQKKGGEIASKGMKNSKYRVEVFPLAFCLHDKTYAGGIWASFPPIPWFFTMVLRWLFMGTYKAWWRFAPCDLTSQPHKMPFA